MLFPFHPPLKLAFVKFPGVSCSFTRAQFTLRRARAFNVRLFEHDHINSKFLKRLNMQTITRFKRQRQSIALASFKQFHLISDTFLARYVDISEIFTSRILATKDKQRSKKNFYQRAVHSSTPFFLIFYRIAVYYECSAPLKTPILQLKTEVIT